MNESDNAQVLFTAPMARGEWSALYYEAHYYLAALALGAVPAIIIAWTVRNSRGEAPGLGPMYAFAALVMLGLFAVFWAASYYPLRVTVKPGAIGFKMLLGRRDIALTDAVKVEAVRDKDEVKKTLSSPGFRSLTPALSGAVMIKPEKGRPWVFSLTDPEAFMQAVATARPVPSSSREEV